MILTEWGYINLRAKTNMRCDSDDETTYKKQYYDFYRNSTPVKSSGHKKCEQKWNIEY